ncbi:ATP-binding protein [Psychroserpens ponticola]|uniref:histidine kinase n=1 Tax=Psychroserpens ponticola TaxID=2932268 RepID=A0ABY7S340_9FLAO|nr:ATP-binding protein [Psychroserpens ponticola]WCO03410.1 PAS domain S-box protein [Psychroserpens ponticola]
MEAINYYISSNLDKNALSLIKDNSMFTVTDSLGRLEYASDSYCAILESNSNRLIGETQKILRSHLHTDSLYKNLWRTLKMGQKWNGVLSETLTSGQIIYLDTKLIPVNDEIENNVKYFGLYDDVTKTYKQNNLLLKASSKHKDFLNIMPFHVFLITRHGKILNANKNYGNLEVSEMIDTYIYDHISLDSFEILKQNINYVNTEKTANQFEITEFDSKGKQHDYSVLVAPVFNKLGGMVSITVTIQENPKTYSINEDREVGSKCRLIYQSINVGIIVVTDHKGNITEWNKGAELAFGYTKFEIIGKPLTILISKKYRKTSIRELLNVTQKLENNQDVDLIEMYCLSKNKEEFPVEFALSSLNIRGQKIYCAMMLDISKRKALENKLQQKTKDLELFLYRSAHDLKAPFSSAEGLLNLLKDEAVSDRNILLEMLDTTIAKGKLLSESLTQASLITLNRNVFSEIDFQDIIENIIQILSCSNNLKKIKVETHLDTPATFNSSPELLSSVFHNLIQNAIKYSKAPTKESISCINISVKTNQDKVVITVIDNGVGIAKDDVKKIFDLYYRANKHDVAGNGLGLYVVKSIVEDLEGEILVKSTINRGTCFEIILPNPK